MRFLLRTVLATLACLGCADPPAPPLPTLEALANATVRDLARPLHDAARERPDDARALASLAQVYEVEAVWDVAADLYLRARALEPDSAAWAYHAAICLQRAGEVDRATALLEEDAPRFHASGPIQNRLGEALLDLDRLDEARAAFERAGRATRHPGPRLGLAEVELAEGRPAEAEALARAVLSDLPSERRAWFLLGRALRERGDREGARAALARGVGAERRAIPDAWMRNAVRYVVGLDLFFNRASELRAAGRAAEHVALLESGRERYADNDRVAVNLGVAYLEAGRLDDARGEFERALGLGPESAELALAQATLHHREGRADLALEATRRACALEPGNVGAATMRAQLALGAGHADEALASARAALAVDRGDVGALRVAASAALKGARWDAAAGHLERLIELAPGDWRSWVQLSLARRTLGDASGSRAAADRARALAPDEPAVRALGGGGGR